MLNTSYIISQIFALLAFISLGISFFVKSKIKIVVFNIACSVFFIFHYFFLNASVGMIINAIGVVRGIWYYLDEKFNSKHLLNSLIVCVVASIVCSVLTFNSWIEIFALIGGLGFTYSLWQKNIGFYRWAMLVCSLLWVTYNSLYGSVVAIVGESVMMVFEIISIVKYYRKDKKELANKNLQENKTNKNKTQETITPAV